MNKLHNSLFSPDDQWGRKCSTFELSCKREHKIAQYMYIDRLRTVQWAECDMDSAIQNIITLLVAMEQPMRIKDSSLLKDKM